MTHSFDVEDIATLFVYCYPIKWHDEANLVTL